MEATSLMLASVFSSSKQDDRTRSKWSMQFLFQFLVLTDYEAILTSHEFCGYGQASLLLLLSPTFLIYRITKGAQRRFSKLASLNSRKYKLSQGPTAKERREANRRTKCNGKTEQKGRLLEIEMRWFKTYRRSIAEIDEWEAQSVFKSL